MGRIISDLPDFTGTVADGDLLVCHNVSNPSNKDEKLTVSKLRTDAILARSNTFTVGNQQITSDGASNRALRLKAAANPTVPVLDVRNSSDLACHELVADYGTYILAARTMIAYQEFQIVPGNIGTSTLTVDIVSTISAAHHTFFTEIIGTFRSNSDGDATRAVWVDDVLWRTRLNSTTNATIDASTRRINNIGSVTVNGPMETLNGIRYTIKSTASDLVRAAMVVRVSGTTVAISVTATVA